MIAGLFASIALPIIGDVIGKIFTHKERKWLAEETAQSKRTAQELVNKFNIITQQADVTSSSLKNMMSEQAIDMQRQSNLLKQHFNQQFKA